MSVPRVSIVVLTHQFEHLVARAIDSALGQRHPADALEVIVVDDGSTDGTEGVVRRYGDRVRYLRHPNVGSGRSLERGLLAARGELVCLLDGDDVLHRDLVARQIEHLRDRPQVGLCSVDRCVVDTHGRCLEPSFARAHDLAPVGGRPLGRLLSENFLTLSGTTIRAGVIPAVLPIVDEAPAEDWWLAVNVARVADLHHIDEVLVDYVQHADNRNLGAPWERTLRLLRRDLRFRAWMLRTLWCSPLVTAEDLLAAYRRLVERAAISEREDPGSARATLPLTAADERMRDAYLVRARSADTAGEAVRLAVAAAGHDMLHPDVSALVVDAARRLDGGEPPSTPAPAPPAAGASSATVVRVDDGAELVVPHERLWAFRNGRYYELAVTHWLSRMMEALPDPVFYDVGSNVGYYAVRFGADARHVYAFEPVSTTFAALDASVRRNGLERVTALPLGLADAGGSAEIHLWSSSGSNTLFERSFGADHPHRPLGTETIELARLDELAARRDLLPPDVMKIDIEGAELPALRGARETLRRHRPHLLVECEADACADAGYRPEDLHRELRDLGYVLFGLSRDPADTRPRPLDGHEREVSNLIALPPGSPLLWELAGELLGGALRRFVAVTWLDDVLAEPALLTEYAAAFGVDDDATLVIWAPGRQEDLIRRLPPLVAELGLDGAGVPDMLGVFSPDREAGPVLRAVASATVGSGGAFDGVARVDRDDVASLAALATGVRVLAHGSA